MTIPASTLDERLRLSPNVSLRRESFGALAYHFGNRRLTFLKRTELVEVVRALDGRRTVREALTVSEIPERQWPAYEATIEQLIGADMLEVVTMAVVDG